jgi:cyclopropane-fatty-acyl-phospholipid synthase
MTSAIAIAEAGLVPDPVIRLGIRWLVRQRLREERRMPDATRSERLTQLRESAIALHTDVANDQHYEVPTEFYQLVLGPHLKYSACIFPNDRASLGEAENHTLQMYADRLDIQPGERVLDLGCGWGSFSLWLAARRPDVAITSVSNSATQKAFIDEQARQRGITNITVKTADVNELDLPENSFDRVISVEMFEHVRNYAQLMEKISRWLTPAGRLFVHIFCHRSLLYPFETEGESNWMGRYFFTGGLMPAADTLTQFQDHLDLVDQQMHAGTHYEKTARAWLDQMDANLPRAREALRATYGNDQVEIWVRRWRMFFMACEEMFAYDKGQQWLIGHYLFAKPE